MIYCILGAGFEEAEGIVPVDMLRRAGLKVAYAGIGGMRVKGSHDIEIGCDISVSDALKSADAEAVILPGGLKGVASIEASPEALELVKKTFSAGGIVAAICAAPTVLGRLGLMKGVRGVCYPGMENEIEGMIPAEGASFRDGNIITGCGPASAYDFALELIRAFKGETAVEKMRVDMAFM